MGHRVAGDAVLVEMDLAGVHRHPQPNRGEVAAELVVPPDPGTQVVDEGVDEGRRGRAGGATTSTPSPRSSRWHDGHSRPEPLKARVSRSYIAALRNRWTSSPRVRSLKALMSTASIGQYAPSARRAARSARRGKDSIRPVSGPVRRRACPFPAVLSVASATRRYETSQIRHRPQPSRQMVGPAPSEPHGRIRRHAGSV